ncbi:hypothetical protein M885DRAFT_572854 [Pelagophyceae sp. CCMP2097]|nr:hypothetical protein M885DRAFT_572854 [Pelagophyceae sp. CCMP2097]
MAVRLRRISFGNVENASVYDRPQDQHKGSVHEFLCHKATAGTVQLPFLTPAHWDDHFSQAGTAFFTTVTDVPRPARYQVGAPTFRPDKNLTYLPLHAVVDVTIVAYPSTDAHGTSGTKFRLMSVSSC